MTTEITLSQLVEQSHGLAKEKGWWPEGQEHNIPEKLMLIVSELSEALEDYRQDPDLVWGTAVRYEANGKPYGFATELADAAIRIADLCGFLELDLGEVVRIKHEFNRTRPHRHGGKRC